MIRVEVKASYQLSEEEKEEFGDDHNILRVYHNERLIMAETDGGEPEDQSFFRDYDWIRDALLEVYEIGKSDGICEGNCG